MLRILFDASGSGLQPIGGVADGNDRVARLYALGDITSKVQSISPVSSAASNCKLVNVRATRMSLKSL